MVNAPIIEAYERADGRIVITFRQEDQEPLDIELDARAASLLMTALGRLLSRSDERLQIPLAVR